MQLHCWERNRHRGRQRCVEASGGSPLALSELLRQLDHDQLAGLAPLPDDLTDGDHLIRSFVDRIDALDAGAQRAVAIVAAALDTTVDDIHEAAKQVSAGDDDLAASEAAGITQVSPESIELVHPLMRTAIRDAVGPEAMREAHAALASVVGDADHARGTSLPPPLGPTPT